MRRGGRLLLGGGALLAVAQCVGAARINPPVRSDLVAPPTVRQSLRAACYDCHSNETRWPWYSALAPLSWWILHHVDEGRRRLNFSDWDAYTSDPESAAQKLDQIVTLVTRGEMAPWYYRWLYAEARLTADERAAVTRWAADEAARLTAAH